MVSLAVMVWPVGGVRRRGGAGGSLGGRGLDRTTAPVLEVVRPNGLAAPACRSVMGDLCWRRQEHGQVRTTRFGFCRGHVSHIARR